MPVIEALLAHRSLRLYISRFLRRRRRAPAFLTGLIRLVGASCLALAAIFTLQPKSVLGLSNPLLIVDTVTCSAPAFVDIDADGDFDAFVGTAAGTLQFYENGGSAAKPVFVERRGGLNPLSSVDVGSISAPAFVDIDNDGDFDVFIGKTYGSVLYFENEGTALSASFTERTGMSNPLSDSVVGDIVSYDSTPAFVDIDDDGDFDAFIGDLYGTAHYFRNTGSAGSPQFTSPPAAQNPLNDVNVGYSSALTFADFDNDGDFDCMIGESYGTVLFYENTGSAMNASFTQRTGGENPLDGIGVGGRSIPVMIDIDDDGDVDSFLGSTEGSVVFVENMANTPSSDVYVDFSTDFNGTGAIDFPFNNLADAVAAAAENASVHIVPALSPETFTGAILITKPVVLLNTGGGTVRIGIGGRSAERSGPAGQSGGFVSSSGEARGKK